MISKEEFKVWVRENPKDAVMIFFEFVDWLNPVIEFYSAYLTRRKVAHALKRRNKE